MKHDAAAIFAHYFALLAKQSGMRWTAANTAEIERAVELLEATQLNAVPTFASTFEDEPEEAPAPVERPRETVIFERPAPSAAEQFRQTREQAEKAATRRMLQRETRP